MVWVQLFPLGTTFINQSVQQIQDNWLFIQNNINTDHYFNDTVTPANEGHHRFVKMRNQAGDPALGGLDGEIYVKPNPSGGTIQPFYRNSTSIRQIPVFYSATNVMGAPANNFNLFNMAGLTVPFYGFFVISRIGGASNLGSGIIAWDGSANVQQLSVSSPPAATGITAISGAGTFIRISQNVPGATNWQLTLITMLP